MEAGRELDALVAEKVMGLHVEWRNGLPMWVGKVLPGSPYVLEDGLYGHTIESYSTEIAAAWKVGEKARAIRLENREPDSLKGWRCSYNGFLGTGETAPLAICRAALEAIEERTE